MDMHCASLLFDHPDCSIILRAPKYHDPAWVARIESSRFPGGLKAPLACDWFSHELSH
jgi:hypothetical protein